MLLYFISILIRKSLSL